MRHQPPLVINDSMGLQQIILFLLFICQFATRYIGQFKGWPSQRVAIFKERASGQPRAYLLGKQCISGFHSQPMFFNPHCQYILIFFPTTISYNFSKVKDYYRAIDIIYTLAKLYVCLVCISYNRRRLKGVLIYVSSPPAVGRTLNQSF